ncbi:unnamed protein product, partial [Bubo scandiacus]
FQGMVGPDDLQEFPSDLKPFCSSGVTTSHPSYHRREKVAPGFKAIPSACCFTPAAALLRKRRRPDSVLLPLQQLVVENKEEKAIACRRTYKGAKQDIGTGGDSGK